VVTYRNIYKECDLLNFMSWKERIYSGLVGVVVGSGIIYYIMRDKGEMRGARTLVSDKEGIVYKGDVDGRNVLYQEKVDVKINGERKKANVMTVRNGRDVYTLIDHENSKSMDWKLNTTPNFEDDRLERIVIVRNDITHTFDRENAGTDTIDAEKTKSLIDKGTNYFNQKRNKLRNQKRIDYSNELKGIEEEFDSSSGTTTPR